MHKKWLKKGIYEQHNICDFNWQIWHYSAVELNTKHAKMICNIINFIMTRNLIPSGLVTKCNTLSCKFQAAAFLISYS